VVLAGLALLGTHSNRSVVVAVEVQERSKPSFLQEKELRVAQALTVGVLVVGTTQMVGMEQPTLVEVAVAQPVLVTVTEVQES
jgi:hypothetical protein